MEAHCHVNTSSRCLRKWHRMSEKRKETPHTKKTLISGNVMLCWPCRQLSVQTKIFSQKSKFWASKTTWANTTQPPSSYFCPDRLQLWHSTQATLLNSSCGQRQPDGKAHTCRSKQHFVSTMINGSQPCGNWQLKGWMMASSNQELRCWNMVASNLLWFLIWCQMHTGSGIVCDIAGWIALWMAICHWMGMPNRSCGYFDVNTRRCLPSLEFTHQGTRKFWKTGDFVCMCVCVFCLVFCFVDFQIDLPLTQKAHHFKIKIFLPTPTRWNRQQQLDITKSRKSH